MFTINLPILRKILSFPFHANVDHDPTGANFPTIAYTISTFPRESSRQEISMQGKCERFDGARERSDERPVFYHHPIFIFNIDH